MPSGGSMFGFLKLNEGNTEPNDRKESEMQPDPDESQIGRIGSGSQIMAEGDRRARRLRMRVA